MIKCKEQYRNKLVVDLTLLLGFAFDIAFDPTFLHSVFELSVDPVLSLSMLKLVFDPSLLCFAFELAVAYRFVCSCLLQLVSNPRDQLPGAASDSLLLSFHFSNSFNYCV